MTEPELDRRTPRWVKMFGIVVVILAVLFAILHLAGVHGGHGMPGGSDMHGKRPG